MESKETARTLDYIDNFTLSGENLTEYSNELNSLRYLSEGLSFLYKQVKKVEVAVVKRIDPKTYILSYGNDPRMAGIPVDLIACSFHWYSVSICNYALMVGWLRHTIEPTSSLPWDYVDSIMPVVRAWRDKVAAHFSKADIRYRGDNTAEKEVSVFYPIAFDDDAFFAAPMKLRMTKKGKRITSDILQKWSLTKTHEQLQPRYWPTH
ncbi:hypothetical protein ACFLY3_01960 [Chloroflexota bacterium]